MTGIKAIKEAMKVFKKAHVGDIRTISLMEGSGSGDKWSSVTIQIGYAVNGDYSESDRAPFVVKVDEDKEGNFGAVRIH